MLVDTCCAHNPEREIMLYMNRIRFDPRRIKYIVISHSDLDHQGGNVPMKRIAPQAMLLCHELDRAWIEDTNALIDGRYDQFSRDWGVAPMSEEAKAGIRAQTLSAPIDMTLTGGETFRLSPDWTVEAVHTPGHTWGHLAMYDPRGKALIAGEAALWNAILDAEWNPVVPPTYCYIDTYLATIQRLLSMDIDVYSGAHWQVQTGAEVKAFLSESRNYCRFVEGKLLEFARRGAFTLPDAIQALAGEVGAFSPDYAGLLAYPFAGHLDALMRRGRLVRRRNLNKVFTWRLPE